MTAYSLRQKPLLAGSNGLPHHGASPARTLRSRGFTLIELIAVVAIIALLVSLIIVAIQAANRYSQRTAALSEVKALSTAWNRYYAEYMQWPSYAQENTAVAMTGTVSRMLAGYSIGSNNMKGFQFMVFSKTNWNGNPVNPWGVGVKERAEHLYYAKFDTDFDGFIRSANDGTPPATDIRTQVIVWTTNVNESTGSVARIIGSW
ncbi:MAG: hypothetical protein C0404_13980 [Verrucomicrobia bacterium]|nr:hypothetical protein [Verrucomicrobiota bacterium]